MTTQSITILFMVLVGVVLFFTGRIVAKKLSSESPAFMPVSAVTVQGIAAYFATLVSWAGALLAVVCTLIFLT